MIGRHLQISNFLKVFHLEVLNPKCRIKYFLDKKKKLQKNVKFWFFISSLVFKVLICKNTNWKEIWSDNEWLLVIRQILLPRTANICAPGKFWSSEMAFWNNAKFIFVITIIFFFFHFWQHQTAAVPCWRFLCYCDFSRKDCSTFRIR